VELSLAAARRIVAQLDPRPPGCRRAIHSIGLARFGYFGRSGPIDGFETKRAFVAAWLERDLRRFAEAGGPAPLVVRVERRGGPALRRGAHGLLVWFARARDAEIAADLDRLAGPA
jgi:hypothetical protein